MRGWETYGEAVAWNLKTQIGVALSTAEGEYVATTHASLRDVVQIRTR